jgi:ABC-2 type transport system ATP-binding protein
MGLAVAGQVGQRTRRFGYRALRPVPGPNLTLLDVGVEAMSEMVRLDRLAKRFGPVRAVDEVSLSLQRGEVLGFLGPNGAGKSTTMRMLTGFIPPTSGNAQVMGFDVVRQPIEVKRRIGYLPEGAPLYGDMTPAAFLRFVAAMRGLKGRKGRSRIEKAVARTQLAEVMHRPIETLSKGFKRRVGLAQAIMHDPPVLVLDEPTDGLDPNQKFEVRKLITEMAAEKAIIISTHILEEVEAVCTRAVVIARGRVVADERPIELQQRSPLHNALRIALDANLAAKAEDLVRRVGGVRAVQEVSRFNGTATLLILPEPGRELAQPVGEVIRRERLTIDGMAVEQGRLEDVFRDLTTTPPA